MKPELAKPCEPSVEVEWWVDHLELVRLVESREPPLVVPEPPIPLFGRLLRLLSKM